MKLSKLKSSKFYAVSVASTLALALTISSLPAVPAYALATDGGVANLEGNAEKDSANTDKKATDAADKASDKQGADNKEDGALSEQPKVASDNNQANKLNDDKASKPNDKDSSNDNKDKADKAEADKKANAENEAVPAPADTQPVVGEARDNGQPAPAPVPAGPAGTKTLADVELPEYAGLIAHTFFCSGADNLKAFMPYVTADEIKNIVTKLLQDKNITDATVTVDNDALNNVNKTVGEQSRKPSITDIKVTVQSGTTQKETKVKLFYYQPPYAGVQSGNIPNNGTTHNTGKLNVEDPNNYTLTQEQTTKLITDFKNANSGLLDGYDLTMDNSGKLTIKDTNNKLSAEVSSEEFISAVAKVSDIYVFLDPTTQNKQSTEIPEIIVKLRNGDYKNGKCWGTNAPGANEPNNEKERKKYFTGIDLKFADNTLKISGKYDTNQSNNVGGGRAIGVRKFKDDNARWCQSFSNAFMVRVLPTKTSTVIRNIDDTDKRFKEEDLAKTIEIDTNQLKDVWLVAGKKGWGFGDINSKEKLLADINKKVTKESKLLSQIKTEVGSYSVKSKFKTDLGVESPELTGTAIYYTETISDTFVANKDKLTDDERNIIKAKVKEANKALKLEDGDITVNEDGSIEIKVKDPNPTANDKKTTVKFTKKAPVVTAKYADKEVFAGKEVKSPIKATQNDQNYTFPEGTIFALPQNPPTGISVNDKTGEITYKAPANQAVGDVTGTILVTLKGATKPTEVPYKFTVVAQGKAGVIYIDVKKQDEDNPETIDKFKAEDDAKKYPAEIIGKKDEKVALDYFNTYTDAKKNPAPKFIGYTFKNCAIKGQNLTFGSGAVLRVQYDKLDEIVDEETYNKNQSKYAGYVKVTFKDVDGAKVDTKDENKVYYVNPKAGVKVQAKGTDFNLVGKNSDGTEHTIKVPAVAADEHYTIKHDANDTNKKWPYNNYDYISDTNKTITGEVTFEAQVAKVPAPQIKPNKDTGDVEVTPAADSNDKIDTIEVTVKVKENGQDKEIKITATKNQDGKWTGNNLPENVTVTENGTIKINANIVKAGAKITAIAKKDNVSSEEAKATLLEAPEVKAEDDGSVKVTMPTDSNVKTVEVSYKDEKGQDKKVTLTKGNDGQWTGSNLPEGVKVSQDGKALIISEESVKDKTEVTAVSKGENSLESIKSKDTAKAKQAASSSSTGSSQTDDRPVYVPSQDVEARIIYPAMTKRKPYVVSKTGEMARNSMQLIGAVIMLLGAVVASKKER